MTQPKSRLGEERARQQVEARQRARAAEHRAEGDLFAPPGEVDQPDQPKPPRPTLDELRAKYPDLIAPERKRGRPTPRPSTNETNLSANQVDIANHRFLLREYERAGIVPIYSGGLLLSLTLARRMGVRLEGTNNHAPAATDETTSA